MNEKVIWDFLISKTRNAYGTAAIMGNLMAESSLNPRNATNLKKTGYSTADQYIIATDDGVHDFAHDGVAFGLVQWCYYSRKQGLLDYAKATGRSVGDLAMQLEYLVKEMSEHYKTAWAAACQANDIRGASDVIMLKYENPATKTEAAKQKRAAYGQKYYDQFASPQPTPSGKKMVRATNQVNIRMTPDKTIKRVGELQKGQELEWISTENGWHKVAVWISGDYSKVISK